MVKEDPRAGPPGVHDVSDVGDRYETLVELLEHQTRQAAIDRERELKEEKRRLRRERSRTPYWVAGVLLLIAAWLWLFPPALLRLDPPPPQPVAQEESALRFAMYLQARRLEAYRLERGEYPDRLEEAGPPLPQIQYVRLAPGLYQLTGATDRLVLTYQSDLPLEEFVGSAAALLEAGGG